MQVAVFGWRGTGEGVAFKFCSFFWAKFPPLELEH